MSIISSIPVLKGHGGTDLTAASEGLLLRSRHDELSIPGQAVARVRAEGGSVAVELRVPAGAAPVAHRIEGVDETAATAFADGVNSLLLEPDEEVDGRSLVVLRTFRTRRERSALRRMKWSALGCLVAVVALSVIGGVAGGFVYPVAIVPIGVLTGACLVAGVHELGAWTHRRRVRGHGVKEFARPANVPGTYLYVDRSGMTRTVSSFGSGPYVEIAYDPEDPADVCTLKPGFGQRLNIWLGTFLFVCGLGGAAALAVITVDALGS
ncbi:hypothetical protein [Streptomyces vietnamensis]|uniref:Uncharacterized protein n=1 Tax=Streptomyces vietnamensis TaxID=362257 RepID=A0A0B5I3U0_9ACTN|nr:hypothetical protein [Streptomyces vietnamensis]AJF65112.1 hypothetical protein SVTN_12475 [Streptomyces vietnamensis]